MTDKITTTLRPGLLVGLTIRITGNVSYHTKDLEGRREVEDGTERARWETERVVKNAKELRAAEKIRSECRQLINKTCARSSFGLLCPNAWEKELYANIAEARRIAGAFNAKSAHTEVGVHAIVGRIAQDDVEATRAINAEVRDLLRDMTKGLQDLDVKKVREAAMKAKSVGMMLSEEAQLKVRVAIDAARASAKAIVKAGEQAASAIDKEVIKKINQSRTAFLDLDDKAGAEPTKPKPRGRAVDLAPEAPKAAKKSGKAAAKEKVPVAPGTGRKKKEAA